MRNDLHIAPARAYWRCAIGMAQGWRERTVRASCFPQQGGA